MKKIAVTSSYSLKNDICFMDTDAFLNHIGGNAGNLLFQDAVEKSIAEDILVVGKDVPWDPKQVRETCRAIVVPAANHIREDADFTHFIDFLEKTDLPLVFLGLGLQAKDYSQRSFCLHLSVKKMLELCKERCKTIGVRGRFTQDFLEKEGITNTSVVGCPSNFINPDIHLHRSLELKSRMNLSAFVGNGDEPWPVDRSKQHAEQKIIKWLSERGGFYVQQSVVPLVKYIRQHNPRQTDEIPENLGEQLRKAIAPDMSLELFQRFISSQVRFYCSVSQWLEDVSRVGLSIGLRLHGNIAAWQAGTPAIWIFHDSRTRELAETMALPNISHEDFLEIEDLETLRSQVFDSYSFDDYFKQRRRLCREYYSALNSNGIECSPTIQSIMQ